MHLHDPIRPQVNYQPAYLTPQGSPIAPAQGLSVNWCEPEEEQNGLVLAVSGFWCHHRFVAKFYEIRIRLGELEQLLLEYYNDPEGVMQKRFGWTWSDQATSAALPRIAPSLADLGLL